MIKIKLLRKILVGVVLLSCVLASAKTNSDENIPITFSIYPYDHIEYAKSIEIMTYPMPNVRGTTFGAKALVFFPEKEKPKDGWKVVVWMHGTVGIDNSCAPSKNELNEGFEILAQSLLKAGYLIVAPDYEGMNSVYTHPYLNLKSEAQSAIYAMKAVQQYYGDEINGDWMVVGQSQGGQAALGVAEYANNDPHFKGAVAGAPASNMDTIIQDVAPIALTRSANQEKLNGIPLEDQTSITSYATLLSYSVFIGLGIRAEHPDFDYFSMFQDRAKPIVEKAIGINGESGLCMGPLRELFKADIIDYLSEHPKNALMSYPALDLLSFESNAQLQSFFIENQPGTVRLDNPVLVIQGELDSSIPAVVTEILVDQLKHLGSPDVELILVPSAHHTEAIIWKNDAVVDFIERHLPI